MRIGPVFVLTRLNPVTIMFVFTLLLAPEQAAAQSMEWERVDVPTSTTFLSDIWACALAGDAFDPPVRAFAVGHDKTAKTGVIYQYDGTSWILVQGTTFPEQYFNSVYGLSTTDVIAVGENVIYRYNGTNWVQGAVNGEYDLRAVWAGGPNDIFAVGYKGLVLHYTGPKANPWTEWQIMDSGTQFTLNGVWGSGPNDVFALGVGDDQMWHFDGSTWSNMPPPSNMGLTIFTDIWGSSASNVFAVGYYGLICHYDGKVWTRMDSGTALNINAVWGSGAGNVYAVGDQGIILHYPIPQPPPPSGWAIPSCCGAGSALPIVSTVFLMRLIPRRRRPRAPNDS